MGDTASTLNADNVELSSKNTKTSVLQNLKIKTFGK